MIQELINRALVMHQQYTNKTLNAESFINVLNEAEELFYRYFKNDVSVGMQSVGGCLITEIVQSGFPVVMPLKAKEAEALKRFGCFSFEFIDGFNMKINLL
jgi:capsule polysaccharide export protein KpsE/RkpR